MAIAQKWLATRYNKPGFKVFDYDVYAVCGDGCLMEGVGSEAASLAGHLGLDNLCWVYDNYHITIEGSTRIAFTEDVAARFMGYGWNVLRVGDANDIERIDHALRVFRETKGRPTFVILDSHIGYGSPHRQDTAAAHGEPLGEDEIRLTKRAYGWPEDAKFLVPGGVREHFASGIGRARRDGAKRMDRAIRQLPRAVPGAGRRGRTDAATGPPDCLGQKPAGVPGGRERACRPQSLREGPKRPRTERALAPWGLGGPRTIKQDDVDLRGRRRCSGCDAGRQEPPLRHPRTRCRLALNCKNAAVSNGMGI